MSGERVMKTATAKATYSVLCLDDDLVITENSSPSITIDQLEGDKLEVWKKREDGFIFVYCNRLEIGYWVLPRLIKLSEGRYMNKYDVGKLQRGMRVTARGEEGVVCRVHEPEWFCHKTNLHYKEFQGADIRIGVQNNYFHAKDIQLNA